MKFNTKNNLIILKYLMILIITNKISLAQEICFDGEFRFNPVYSRGFRKPMYEGDKAALFTMQRTRLMFNYTKQKDLEAEIVLQDRRFWGDQSDREDAPNMALYRGWVEKYFTPEFSIRLGRQGLVYDDQYLLGDPNWVGTRAHDVALLKYETDSSNFKTHLGLAYNANGQELTLEPFKQNIYKNMQFLWIHKEFEKGKISLIGLNRGMDAGQDTASDICYMQTFGPELTLDITKNITVKGILHYQIGEDVKHKTVNAYFYSAQIIYTPTESIEFNPGIDVNSGTSQNNRENPNYTKSQSFDRHYGLVHGHFGYLDYFYVNKATLCGIQDIYLKTKVKVSKKITFENHIHSFLTEAKINNVNNNDITMNNYLGIENDFLVHYKISSIFKATVGHSIMFGTNTLDQFFGGKKGKEMQVIYAVITATPSFFKTKK